MTDTLPRSFRLHDTSHYVGPTITYAMPKNVSVVFSPNFGLNSYSLDHIYRIGFNYELGQAFERTR